MIVGQNWLKCCRSHNQDGHHAHIWLNPLTVCSLESNDITGEQHFRTVGPVVYLTYPKFSDDRSEQTVHQDQTAWSSLIRVFSVNYIFCSK